MKLKNFFLLFILFISFSFPLYGMDKDEHKNYIPINLHPTQKETRIVEKDKGFEIVVEGDNVQGAYFKNDELNFERDISYKFRYKMSSLSITLNEKASCELIITGDTLQSRAKQRIWSQTYNLTENISIQKPIVIEGEAACFFHENLNNVKLWVKFLNILPPYRVYIEELYYKKNN